MAGLLGPEDEAFYQELLRDFASVVIQRCVRGWLARRAFTAQRRAAVHIQRSWRALGPAFTQRAAAVRRIERAWASHCCRLSYHALRQFVRAAEGSDPRRALAAIAQHAEAGLADVAAGVRVRFRLSGTAAYTPQLVYSIFTHRPVAQLGLGSPAPDPMAATIWRPVPPELYSKLSRVSSLVALVRGPAGAAQQRGTHSGSSRGASAGGASRRPSGKRRRLQQLYEEGRQVEEQGAAGDAAAGGGLGRGACDSVQQREEGPAEEGEEELEQWYQQLLQLDYNAYMASWMQLGGSAWTDEAVAQRK